MGRGGRETKVFRGFLWPCLAGVREAHAGQRGRWVALKARVCRRGEKLRTRRAVCEEELEEDQAAVEASWCGF